MRAVSLDVGDRGPGEELPVLDLAREGRHRGARRRVERADGMLEAGLLAGRPGGVGRDLRAEAARDDRLRGRAELSDGRLSDRPQEGWIGEVRPRTRSVRLQNRPLAAVRIDREGGM